MYSAVKAQKAKNRYMDEDQIWSYFIQLCLGIRALHNMNILHRVRPSMARDLTHCPSISVWCSCAKPHSHASERSDGALVPTRTILVSLPSCPPPRT